ncbi:hypothetical protein EII18_10440 [Comamonadaceae bacterium OH3737_COT-264]|nr:hypothetical protein EII18_10440 [Comamonadaceae bacterium OH3737_COT-264]
MKTGEEVSADSGRDTPEVVERLVGSPDAVLEKVMRRPWPNGWGDQMRVLAPPGVFTTELHAIGAYE